jgi:hypothetical protein
VNVLVVYNGPYNGVPFTHDTIRRFIDRKRQLNEESGGPTHSNKRARTAVSAS